MGSAGPIERHSEGPEATSFEMVYEMATSRPIAI